MTLLAHYKLDDNAANTTVTAQVGVNGSVVVGGNTSAIAVGAGNGPGGSLADAGFSFDGIDDYVSCPDPKDGANSFLGGERHTICAWLKTTDTELYVVPVGNFHTANPYWYLLQYNRGVNTLVSSGIGWVGTAAIFQKATGAGEYTDGTWRHVCVTRIDNTSTKLFINGVNVGGSVSPSNDFGRSPSFNQPFFIGAYNNIASSVASGHTDCEVADVRIYNSDESANLASIIDDARPTCSVSISGTAQVGQTLTATPLTNDSTATFEYQWYRADNASGLNEAAISGATSSTYTAQAADEGKYLRCRGRSTNTGGAGLQSNYEFSDYTAAVTPSGSGHNLTANSLSSGTPALDSPALTQEHVLTASALTSGTPVLDSPVLSQDGQLTANPLSAGTPTLGSPALNQNYVLTANALSAGAPTLASPALSQTHVLAANPLNAGTPTLDAPVLGQPGQLAANPLTTGAPTLGSPALSQIHVLGTDGVSAGSPTLGSPALAVNSNLTASSLSAGTPTLGSPVLGVDGAIVANPLTTGIPTLGSPALSQIHVLSILSLTTGVPALGRPILNWDQIPYTPSYLRTFYPSISLPERTVPQLSFGNRTFALPYYSGRTFPQIPYDNRTGIPNGS